MSSPAELNYARKSGRRRLVLRLFIGVLAVLAAVAAITQVPSAFDRVQAMRAQSQCVQDASAARTIVYQTGVPTADDAVPRAWRKFHEAVLGTGLRSAGTVFLNERSTSDGQKVLVAVDLVYDGSVVEFVSRAIAPGTLLRLPRPAGKATFGPRFADASGSPASAAPSATNTAPTTVDTLTEGPGRSSAQPTGGSPVHTSGGLSIYRGRVHLSDPTRFAIDYALHSVPGTIDGWVRDDGSILLEIAGH